MGWAARKKQQAGNPVRERSGAARAYTLEHVPELFARGEGFTDTRGRRYTVAPDGSLKRLQMRDEHDLPEFGDDDK